MVTFVPDKELFQYPLGKTMPRHSYDVGKARDLSGINPDDIVVYFPFGEEVVDKEEMFDHIEKTMGFRIHKYLFLGNLPKDNKLTLLAR